MKTLDLYGKGALLVELLYREYQEAYARGETYLDFTSWFQHLAANNSINPYSVG